MTAHQSESRPRRHVLIIDAPDGTHRKRFASEAAAVAALKRFLGREDVEVGPTYYDDFGGVVYALPA